MHWSDKIAERIIQRNPNKEEYVCAAGISPSGSIHIGNFRDIATSLFVVKALERKGKKARLLFSWDEFDRMRKVPKNVAAVHDDYEQYVGYPYVDVPNPFDGEAGSYADYFEQEFMASMEKFGIKMDYRYQADMYRSGKYKDLVMTALKKRGEIFDILDSLRTQDAQEGEREAYYPVSIYCPCCKRDTTKITSLTEDCTTAEYECKCGHHGTFNFLTDFNCKLAWKIDWPMRWLYEGVDFEPGGKDHASPGGSYDNAKIIAKKIFNYPAPLFQGYEFIGIKGSTGKMSGSTGLNLTPDTLLKIYEPDIIIWLYARSEPTKAFDFCFDDGILRQYFEFDKQYNQYISGKCDEKTKDVMGNCLISGQKINTVPFSHLAQFGSIVNFNPEMLEIVFEKIAKSPEECYKYADFRNRLDRARYWLMNCSPESVNHLGTYRNFEVYKELDEDEKKAIAVLYDYLSTQDYTLDDLNTKLYAIPKEIYGEDRPDIKKVQGKFFNNVYRLLLGKETGPRLYLFLFAIEKASFLPLLDFSYPETDEEKEMKAAEEAAKNAPAEEEKKIVYGDPDPVAPVKPEITLEDFNRIDLRVCEVRKCQEIRKARNNYKLTLFDGEKERVIVSSIKDYYKPEEMVGKKIIVVANLAPARLTGVKSEGMLLAGTNNACGCQVIFVDPIVPAGTPIR